MPKTLKPTAILRSAVTLLALLAVSAAGEPPYDRAAVGPFSIVGDEDHALMLGLGAFDFAQEESLGTEGTRLEGRVEIRGGQKLFYLGPLIGLRADADGGVLGYGGIYLDVEIGRWSVIPAGSIAGYRRGDSKDLDSSLLFQIELSGLYRLESGIGLGLTFAHVSNGYRVDRNPGAESLLVTALIPF